MSIQICFQKLEALCRTKAHHEVKKSKFKEKAIRFDVFLLEKKHKKQNCQTDDNSITQPQVG